MHSECLFVAIVQAGRLSLAERRYLVHVEKEKEIRDSLGRKDGNALIIVAGFCPSTSLLRAGPWFTETQPHDPHVQSSEATNPPL